MAGTTTRLGQNISGLGVNQGAGSVSGSGTPLDGSEVPFVFPLDELSPDKPGFGVDSTDANATQATGGWGIRGWLSTLVVLFRAGTARVVTANLTAAADVVTVVAQNGALTDTRSTPFAAAIVDTATFGVGNNNKRLIYVVVGVAINWVTSGNVTVQPYVATSAQTGVTTLGPLIDTTHNLLGSNGVTLPAGTYVLDSSIFPSFAQPHLFMGLRFVFPSTPTNAAGASLISVLSGTNT